MKKFSILLFAAILSLAFSVAPAILKLVADTAAGEDVTVDFMEDTALMGDTVPMGDPSSALAQDFTPGTTTLPWMVTLRTGIKRGSAVQVI